MSARLFSGWVTLGVACEMIAELRDFDPAKLLLVVSRGPLLFFPNAKQNGDKTWRVPAMDMRSLVGEGVPDRAVKVRTFARWWEVTPKTVTRAINRGVIRKVEFLGEWRIPVSEFARLMGSAPVSGGRLSFFARDAGLKSMKEVRR